MQRRRLFDGLLCLPSQAAGVLLLTAFSGALFAAYGLHAQKKASVREHVAVSIYDVHTHRAGLRAVSTLLCRAGCAHLAPQLHPPRLFLRAARCCLRRRAQADRNSGNGALLPSQRGRMHRQPARSPPAADHRSPVIVSQAVSASAVRLLQKTHKKLTAKKALMYATVRRFFARLLSRVGPQGVPSVAQRPPPDTASAHRSTGVRGPTGYRDDRHARAVRNGGAAAFAGSRGGPAGGGGGGSKGGEEGQVKAGGHSPRARSGTTPRVPRRPRRCSSVLRPAYTCLLQSKQVVV